jgi:hypothetical protein
MMLAFRLLAAAMNPVFAGYLAQPHPSPAARFSALAR